MRFLALTALLMSAASAAPIEANPNHPSVKEVMQRSFMLWSAPIMAIDCRPPFAGPIKSCRSANIQFHFSKAGQLVRIDSLRDGQVTLSSVLSRPAGQFNITVLTQGPDGPTQTGEVKCSIDTLTAQQFALTCKSARGGSLTASYQQANGLLVAAYGDSYSSSFVLNKQRRVMKKVVEIRQKGALMEQITTLYDYQKKGQFVASVTRERADTDWRVATFVKPEPQLHTHYLLAHDAHGNPTKIAVDDPEQVHELVYDYYD